MTSQTVLAGVRVVAEGEAVGTGNVELGLPVGVALLVLVAVLRLNFFFYLKINKICTIHNIEDIEKKKKYVQNKEASFTPIFINILRLN